MSRSHPLLPQIRKGAFLPRFKDGGYSHANVSCIDGTGYLLIIGTFDDGSCIGKYCQFVAINGTAE
jgi:hypothetical protein